jgi:hypothetical protein
VFLQYLLGLRRLGWEVLFLDRLEAGMCTDALGNRSDFRSSVQVDYLTTVLQRFGLEDAYSLAFDGGQDRLGLDERDVVEFARSATAVLDFNGYLADEAVLGAVPTRVFIDIDPGFNQVWCELGLHDPFASYDRFVTVGADVGQEGCGVPTCGHPWIPTRQPVVLEEWTETPAGPHAPFTSVATWRGDFGVLDFEGRTLGLRVHEFRRFADLPRRVTPRFECALDIDPEDGEDGELLRRGGWSLVDPHTVAGTPDAYRDFIRSSAAELCIAKNIYVELATGWFSDRSVCYLASGRPVIAQETGFSRSLPVGEGLFAIADPDDARSAVESVTREPSRHAEAARNIAEEYFDSDRVLTRLMEQVGSTAGSAAP